MALLISEGAITGSDGRSMYEVARSFVDSGTLTVDSSLGVPGRGGAHYSKFGIGQSLMAGTAYIVAKPLAQRLPMPDQVEQAAVSATMAFVYGALVAILFTLARRLGASVRPAVYTALGAVIGTFVLPYSKQFFSEPLTTLCILASIERAVSDRPLMAGFWAAAAGLTRPQAFAFTPFLFAGVWRKSGRLGALKVASVMTAGLIVALAYNLVRFGSPLDFGYRTETFSTQLSAGTWGLLGHPAKSVVLFAPITLVFIPSLLRLAKRDAVATFLISSNLLVTFVQAATWLSWAGGWAWGPRLIISGMVPAIAAVAPWCEASRWRTNLVAALFILGAIVSVPAVLVSPRAQQLDQPPPAIGPNVIRQYQLIAPTARYTWQHLFQYEKGVNQRYLPFWQVGAARVLGPRGLIPIIILTALLLTAATAAGWRLRAYIVQSDPSSPREVAPDPTG